MYEYLITLEIEVSPITYVMSEKSGLIIKKVERYLDRAAYVREGIVRN